MLLVLLILFNGSVLGQRNPVFTVVGPDVIRPNTDYYAAVSSHGKAGDFSIKITGLADSGQSIEIREETSVRSGETQTIRLRIGDLGPGEYELSVKGPDGFSDSSKLRYVHRGYSVFIQTDKAIYRPGNTVKFRAVVVNPKLKPSVTGSIDLRITDGKGNLIRKWDRVFTSGGAYANEFNLDEFPVMGQWNITVEISGQNFYKTFEVAQYVLPKFNVDISTPKYGLFSDGETKITITAKDRLGRPVSGTVVFNAIPRIKSGFIQPFFNSPARKKTKISEKVDIYIDFPSALSFTEEYARDIILDVYVKEDETERVQNKTVIYSLYKHDYKLEMVRTANAFKPNMPYKAYIKLAKQDDTPISGEENSVEVKWGFSNKPGTKEYNTTTLYPDKDGIIELSIDTPEKGEILGIEAKYKNLIQWFSTVPRAVSRSNTFIQARLIENRPKIGSEIKIEVMSSANFDSLSYVVFGRGKVIFASTQSTDGGTSSTIRINATPEMSPYCRVLTFLVTSSGDIIADSLDFEVQGLLTNFVDISSTQKTSIPSKDLTLNIKSKPNSFVGILAVDQRVRFLKNGHDILLKDVFDDLRSYDSAVIPSFFSWFKVINPKKGSLSWHLGSSSSSDTFSKTGTIVLTNGYLEKSPELSDEIVYSGENRPFGRPLPRPDVPTLNPDKGPGVEYESATRPPLEGPFAWSKIPQPVDNVPKVYLERDLPRTWLFLNATTDSEGKASIPVKAPDYTNTTWLITGFSLDNLHGLGISENAEKVEVFQPFYVEVQLPPRVKLGEVLAVQMVVYNYLSKRIPAEVILESSGESPGFIFGSHPNEIEDSNSEAYKQKDITIAPGRGTLVTFLITPIRTGDVEIKVRAKSQFGSDIRIELLRVESEGEGLSETKSFYMSPGDKLNETLQMSSPFNSVPDSTELTLSGTLDPLGITMNNLDDLLTVPTQCGEQNLIHIIPPTIILNYLNEAKLKGDSIRRIALKTMENGYQRQLRYRHLDGSFSLFGPHSDKSSLWVTALVASSFRAASEYITIDDKVLSKALYWITSSQNDDGSFAERGKIYFKDLQESTLPMTALSVLSLLDNKKHLDAALRNSLNRGIDYLSEHWKDLQDIDNNPFPLSIVSYALTAASHPSAKSALLLLDSVKKFNGTRQWLEKKPSEPDNPWNSRTSSIDVSSTAYYALSLLSRKETRTAIPLINWLFYVLNPNGGFESSFDTFVGLKALKMYAENVKAYGETTPGIIQYAYGSSARKFDLDSSTILLKRILPPNTDKLQLKGAGPGLIQASRSYSLNVTGSWPTFVVDTQVLPSSKAQLHLSVCVHHIIFGSSNTSNMAVMEIDLPSGFTINEDSLPALRRYESIIKAEAENRNTRVVIYFNEIGSKELCPAIIAFRTHRVAEQRPGMVRVYDYYDQSKVSRSFYRVSPSTLCDITDRELSDCPVTDNSPRFGSYAVDSNVDSLSSTSSGALSFHVQGYFLTGCILSYLSLRTN